MDDGRWEMEDGGWKMGTNKVTTAILKFINSLPHSFAMRVNTMGVYDPRLKRYRTIRDKHSLGRGDIIACLNGWYVEVEVKTGHDKQSERQKEHQEMVERCGGIYILASVNNAQDLDEVLEKLQAISKV